MSAPARPVPVVMTLRQVAQRLGISENTLRYWRKSGSGPPGFRMGRRIVFRPADVDAWLARLAGRAPRPAENLASYPGEHLNQLASVLTQIHEFVPLQVRYQAAAAALRVVRDWQIADRDEQGTLA